MTRGRTVPTQLFGSSNASHWQNLNRLPVKAVLRSRKRAALTGRQGLDWRQSTQQWLKGGRLSTVYTAHPRYHKPGRMVVLWDVSGSMASYLGLYLPWLWKLVQLSPDVGVFPFGTQVADITLVLRQPYHRVQRDLAELGNLWVGGTSIGRILEEFDERFAPVWVRRGTVVVIVSDGWDVGDPTRISAVLRQWKSQDVRIYWLNPLAATPGFEPKTRALLAALPYVNRMMSGHSVEALRRLYFG